MKINDDNYDIISEEILESFKNLDISSDTPIKEASVVQDNLSIIPYNDESLLSWLLRQSWKFGLTIKEFLLAEKDHWIQDKNLDISLPIAWKWLERIDIKPLNIRFQKILTSRGLNKDPSELQVDIPLWINNISTFIEQHKSQLGFFYQNELKICPLCWKDESKKYFKKNWRLSGLIICPEHNIYFIKDCPKCKHPLFDNIHNFVEKWLTICQHCGYNYLDRSYPNVNEGLIKIQSLIISAFFEDNPNYLSKVFLDSTVTIEEHNIFSKILKRRGGYQGIQGLYIAKVEIYSYQLKENKLPTNRDGFHGIQTALGRKEWEKYNILTWNDLLQFLFKKVNLERGKYEGEDGLHRALKEIRDFYAKHQKLPTNREPELAGIYNALYKGEWKEFGYPNWNVLLVKEFGKLNTKMNYYIGEKGLKNAIQVLKDLYDKTGEIPTSTLPEIKGILTAITRGEWLTYGIKTWNDLLEKVFGKINLEQKKYESETALETVMKELQDFFTKNRRLPRTSDQDMNRIATAVARKRFVKYEILIWNDLLIYVFGEINFVGRDAYIDEKGLKLAKHKIESYFKEYHTQPRPSSKGMLGIYRAIKNGNFKVFSIHSWDDLLIYVFDKVEKKKYTRTKISNTNVDKSYLLQEASIECKKFKEKYGRIPNTRDQEIQKILYNIKKGIFKEFEIITWNDFLKHTFHSVNQRKGVYIGKEGLIRAKNELKEFLAKNRRKPVTLDKEIAGILRAVKRGEWKEDGIQRWNELLIDTFKEVNLNREPKTN